MARTLSTMVELGSSAADFDLLDTTTGDFLTRDSLLKPKGLLVIFMCNHCPYVKHIEEEIAQIGQTYTDRLAMAAISANDVSFYPDDSPDNLKEQARRLGFNFPYFYDDRQEVSKEYR